MTKLKPSFFARRPEIVARDLLGCYFVRVFEEGSVVAKIVETEAYLDEKDLASHARFGVTKRNSLMFSHPGIFYVYMIYGIFYLTNVVCDKENQAGAVLLRSAEIVEGEKIVIKNLAKSKFVKPSGNLATGPGKLSLAMAIDNDFSSRKILNPDCYFLEKDNESSFQIIQCPRVGVSYAKEWKDKPLRFYIKNNKFVSKK